VTKDDFSKRRIVNPKQKRFAEEYVVDHNATAAATRAGYAERSAKQLGHRMLRKPDVAQLIAKLDAVKAGDLGLEARDALARVVYAWERAIEEQPKIWKGQPVTLNHPGFDAHLLSWEGGVYAKEVRREHEGEGGSSGGRPWGGLRL
jgi:hypothetical protein